MRIGIVAILNGAVVVAAILGGCGETPIVGQLPDCWTPEEGFAPCDRDAGPDADASDAGGDVAAVEADGGEEDAEAGPPCEGECVPLRPTDYPFSDPHQVWFGPKSEAPACRAGVVAQFVRYAGLTTPPCPSCSCLPSTGSCTPPSSFVAHAATCDAVPGAAETPFDAPASWDGACTAENAVPAGLDCGGVPCVQSLTVGPLGKADDGCTSYVYPPLPLPEPTWELAAVACEGTPTWHGCGSDAMCVPEADPGFRQCVFIEGDFACPAEGYTDRLLYYREYTHDLHCSDCACGPVEGSVCAATALIYKDTACGTFLMGTSISSDEPTCQEMSPKGPALGSKLVTELTYYPGSCAASGGVLEGTAQAVGPVTFCCLP